MPQLDPVVRGTLSGVGRIVLAALFAVPLVIVIPHPTPALLRDIANIGVVLVLGYVVEAVWLVPRMARQAEDYEELLGVLTGMALAGLVGILVAVLVSAHLAAGHANLLDDLGLAWSAASLIVLGGMVGLQPLLVDIWDTSKDPEP
jgi:hypothetical protein